MTKKKINFIPAYLPGDRVFVISSTIYRDDPFMNNHCKIFSCIIDSITINKQGVFYWVQTEGKDGKYEDWQDQVLEQHVHKNKMLLIVELLKLWKI